MIKASNRRTKVAKIWAKLRYTWSQKPQGGYKTNGWLFAQRAWDCPPDGPPEIWQLVPNKDTALQYRGQLISLFPWRYVKLSRLGNIYYLIQSFRRWTGCHRCGVFLAELYHFSVEMVHQMFDCSLMLTMPNVFEHSRKKVITTEKALLLFFALLTSLEANM